MIRKAKLRRKSNEITGAKKGKGEDGLRKIKQSEKRLAMNEATLDSVGGILQRDKLRNV